MKGTQGFKRDPAGVSRSGRMVRQLSRGRLFGKTSIDDTGADSDTVPHNSPTLSVKLRSILESDWTECEILF